MVIPGLEFLSKEAVDGIVRIDKITKALSVTKGSFYWHLKNRDDFIKNLIIYHDDTYVHNVVRFVDGMECASSLFRKMGFQGEELEMRTPNFVIFMTNEATFLVKKSKKERLVLAKLAFKMFTAPPNKFEKGG